MQQTVVDPANNIILNDEQKESYMQACNEERQTGYQEMSEKVGQPMPGPIVGDYL